MAPLMRLGAGALCVGYESGLVEVGHPPSTSAPTSQYTAVIAHDSWPAHVSMPLPQHTMAMFMHAAQAHGARAHTAYYHVHIVISQFVTAQFVGVPVHNCL